MSCMNVKGETTTCVHANGQLVTHVFPFTFCVAAPSTQSSRPAAYNGKWRERSIIDHMYTLHALYSGGLRRWCCRPTFTSRPTSLFNSTFLVLRAFHIHRFMRSTFFFIIIPRAAILITLNSCCGCGRIAFCSVALSHTPAVGLGEGKYFCGMTVNARSEKSNTQFICCRSYA